MHILHKVSRKTLYAYIYLNDHTVTLLLRCIYHDPGTRVMKISQWFPNVCMAVLKAMCNLTTHCLPPPLLPAIPPCPAPTRRLPCCSTGTVSHWPLLCNACDACLLNTSRAEYVASSRFTTPIASSRESFLWLSCLKTNPQSLYPVLYFPFLHSTYHTTWPTISILVYLFVCLSISPY